MKFDKDVPEGGETVGSYFKRKQSATSAQRDEKLSAKRTESDLVEPPSSATLSAERNEKLSAKRAELASKRPPSDASEKGYEKMSAKRADWALKKHQLARDILVKRGFDLNGLIMLDDSFDEGAFEYLLVFPDRVEYINHGKPGLLGKKGKGTEVIPISRISSVTTTKKRIFETVKITTSGQAIEFKSTPWVAPILKQIILGLMTKEPAITTNEPQPLDPTEQLAKVAELHKAGILTDEEFAEKKTELLKRI